jgi:hypothetical protein
MTEDEKWISFMNRYFVFKKTHNVDAERIYKQFVSKKMLGDLAKQADELEDALELANEKAKEAKKSKIRKLSSKEKVVIDTYSPVLDSAEDIVPPQEIEKIASSVAAIASEEEEPRVLAEELAPIPSSVPLSVPLSVPYTKPKLVLGSPISIKVTKPKIVIGEPVKVIKKIKKAEK